MSPASLAADPPAARDALHAREHRSLLADLEKRALVCMARRLPAWVTPDLLSALGLAALLGAGFSFACARFWPPALLAGVACLAVNWFGDSLDGTLARVRAIERPRYGYYLDHVLDIAGSAALFGGIAASGFMSPAVALATLAGYLALSAEAFLATHALGVFRLSFAGIGPTELRLLLSVGFLWLLRGQPDVPVPFFGHVRLFDLGGGIAVAGMAAVLAVSAWRNAAALARLEPARRPPGATR
jgi:archaetidylinositol phosphate synthase